MKNNGEKRIKDIRISESDIIERKDKIFLYFLRNNNIL